MVLDEILQRFLDRAPVAVMVRAAIVRTVGDSTLNDLFDRNGDAQYTRDLTFSALTRLMTQVVFLLLPLRQRGLPTRRGHPRLHHVGL